MKMKCDAVAKINEDEGLSDRVSEPQSKMRQFNLRCTTSERQLVQKSQLMKCGGIQSGFNENEMRRSGED